MNYIDLKLAFSRQGYLLTEVKTPTQKLLGYRITRNHVRCHTLRNIGLGQVNRIAQKMNIIAA